MCGVSDDAVVRLFQPLHIMKHKTIRLKNFTDPALTAVAILSAGLLASRTMMIHAQTLPGYTDSSAASTTTTATTQDAWKLTNDQLDSLVAPIALYPDPLLSQVLVASTYPLEIIQLQQWLSRNTNLKDQALADAVKKQPWDPSIQGLVAVPDVIERCAGNIQWTTELGNAFLAQPQDVMDAIQRMRDKAQDKNVLVSNTQQTVTTQVVEGEEVIIVQQADPKVVYVPSYDPVVVYGAPAYPYPSYVYPGYVPGTALAFGVGIALGACWGDSWGYNCGWHGGDVDINVNNNYVRNSGNYNNINGGKWAHQPAHRGGAPYGRGGINGVGGGTRPGGVGGVGGAGRPGGVGGIGGAGSAGRPGGAGGIGGAGSAGKPGGAGGIGGAGSAGKPGGAGGIGGAGSAGKPGGVGGAGSAGRPSSGSGVSRPSTQPASRSSSSSIGGRSVSSGSSASRSAFSGSSHSGSAARSSSSRGGSSMRSSGGGSRGGGGGGRRR